MTTLQIDDTVIRLHDNLKGTVIGPGPYGDEPLQIVDENGQHYSFIHEDGTSTYNGNIWRKVCGTPLMKREVKLRVRNILSTE